MVVNRRLQPRVKPMKSHKSKQGANLFFAKGVLYYADAPVKKVVKYSVDDQDILSTFYTKSQLISVADGNSILSRC